MKNYIILSSGIMKVEKIVGKTKAILFKDLKIGDRIEFSVELKYAGRNKGTHATYIKTKNLKTGDYTHNSFNQISPLLDKFKFEKEEINDR